MKDIHYFLEEEDKYCQNKSEEFEVCNEEVQEWEYKRVPLDFLRQRPFQCEYDNIAYKKELTKGYDLSDAELTMLGLFIMHHSRCFRDDYYGNNIPEIAKNMFDVLDNAISKAPVTQSETLFRFCVDEDSSEMEIGETITFSHNLTCTTERWDRRDNSIYIITTLPHDKTRAHDVYRMYPHNEREKQVNFLRGSSFLITNIDNIEGTKYHKFYMSEIEGMNK